MPEFDEYNQLLVTNPFADDDTSKNEDTLVTNSTLTFGAFSDHHPLRSQSTIPSVTVIDSQGETRPSLTRLLVLDESPAEDTAEEVPDEVPQGDGNSDIITHPVGPNDSFAGVALRYGVSIAALRRANQLWPSDPIHFRTELFIPRGDTLPPRHKPTHSARADTTLEPAPGSSPDPVASSFFAARNMILSVLPARISLDSLSSKASAGEDHELDDLQSAHTLSSSDLLSHEQGHELSVLAPVYERSTLPLACPATHDDQHLDVNHIPPISALRTRPIASSRTVSGPRLPRIRPFAVLPVRTSQLEPEPAMELPVRFPAFSDHSP